MALVIRMRQQGRKNRQTFRLVVTDKKNPRDGKYVEAIGSYDPQGGGDRHLQVQIDRLAHWMGLGAQISERARSLVKRVAPELMRKFQMQAEHGRLKEAAQRRRPSKTA